MYFSIIPVKSGGLQVQVDPPLPKSGGQDTPGSPPLLTFNMYTLAQLLICRISLNTGRALNTGQALYRNWGLSSLFKRSQALNTVRVSW